VKGAVVMGFYEQISKYYDYIFPAEKAQVEFIKEAAGPPPAKILDVACGSGGYSIELARVGYDMTAVDLDAEMVRLAAEKARENRLDIDVQVCDMKDIEKRFSQKFNTVFCIGNSIVHLGSPEEISDAIRQMYEVLEPGGSLVLQIINFDRVFRHKISELPPIKNDDIGLEFIRKYIYSNDKESLVFHTVLTVGSGEKRQRFENSIKLFPVKSADLVYMLVKAGFKDIRDYGGFDRSEYNDDAYLLVTEAKK